MDGNLDEVRLSEDAFINRHAGGKFCRDVVQHGVECLGQPERVRAGLFLNAENHRRLLSRGAFAALRFLAYDDVAEVGDFRRNTVGGGHDRFPDVFQRAHASDAGNQPFRTAFIDEPDRDVLVAFRQRACHLIERDAVGLQLGLRQHDLELLHAAADGRDLRHPRYREDAPANHRVRRGAEFDGCVLLRRERDKQDFAHDGRHGRKHGPVHFRRQFACRDVDLLADDLSGGIDVRAPAEFNPHDGQAHRRRGAHAPHAGRAVDGGFDGEGHLALHLAGHHATRFGDDGHRRRGEIREHIHRHLEGGVAADDQQQGGHYQDRGAIAQ